MYTRVKNLMDSRNFAVWFLRFWRQWFVFKPSNIPVSGGKCWCVLLPMWAGWAGALWVVVRLLGQNCLRDLHSQTDDQRPSPSCPWPCCHDHVPALFSISWWWFGCTKLNLHREWEQVCLRSKEGMGSAFQHGGTQWQCVLELALRCLWQH